MADPNKNWISLNRSLLLNDMWRAEPFTKGQAWVDMLLATNFKDGVAYLDKGVNVPVKRGQMCRSMKQLAIRWKWSEGKVKRYLEFLSENLEQITFENWYKNGAGNGAGKNAVTTLITITNYETYQDNEANDSAQTAQEQRTDSAQTATYNKVNKGNKENKESVSGKFRPPTQEEVDLYMAEIGFLGDAGRFVDYYIGNGWMAGKNKMKDWQAAVRTWQRNDNKAGRPPTGRPSSDPFYGAI